MASTTFSELLGYISILCWLCAQFPQVVKNIHRQSCDGLALPFLLNWFLGDASNLIGCILTHQLPFQTWLAAYFVCVDCTLVVQYFYYAPRTKASYDAITAANIRRMSIERGASRYRTLSAVAANVAATAALAAQHDNQFDLLRGWERPGEERARPASSAHTLRGSVAEDDVDEQSLALLAESFHSERGHDVRRQQLSWNPERRRRRAGSAGPYSTLSHPPISAPAYDSRGRSLQRGDSTSGPELIATGPRGRSSGAGRRSSAIVFLAVWALFGVGSFVNQQRTSSGSAQHGTVVGTGSSSSSPIPVYSLDTSRVFGISLRSTFDDPLTHDLQSLRFVSERVIGRIFAWICTTMYITSRLPQIWKNYVRQSVEGLSMYLFVFAFLGNIFYVASILTSPRLQLPQPAAEEFLRESIPYLLGSAGTLMFDVTIVTQAFLYRRKRRRRDSVYGRLEEESGLLGSDALIRSAESAAFHRSHVSRSRTSGLD